MIGKAVRNVVVVVASLAVALAWVESARADEHDQRLRLERDATKLVERVDETGREIRFHVGRLEEFVAHPDVNRWTHAEHLDRIASLVNDRLRPTLKQLSDAQGRLPEWKQDSIDRIVAAARDLAADTTSAFFRKNQNPKLPPMMNEEYRQLIRNLASHAESLITIADAAHAFALGRLKAAEAGLSVTP